jgi:hypothetical protein
MLHAARRGITPRLFAALLALAAPLVAFAASAEAPTVGEISAPQEDTARTIKTTLSEELAKMKLPKGKKFIVSASLVKLETKQSGADSTTQAIVSLAIRDAKDGAIRGVINGSGSIKSRSGDPTVAKLVVETAVRGATRNLPSVMAQ